MKMIEELKAVEIHNLSKEEMLEHKKNVLELGEEGQIVDYLKFAIDNFYKTEEEGDNNESVDLFFESEEFKPFYNVILTSNETEE
jgi:hypothetical protein